MARSHELYVSGSKLLQPSEVASSIRWIARAYKYKGGRTFDADVLLSDCDRQIKWSTYGVNGAAQMRDKLTVAICELRNARAAISLVGEHYEKLASKKRSRK
jgi:hypothetical protein